MNILQSSKGSWLKRETMAAPSSSARCLGGTMKIPSCQELPGRQLAPWFFYHSGNCRRRRGRGSNQKTSLNVRRFFLFEHRDYLLQQISSFFSMTRWGPLLNKNDEKNSFLNKFLLFRQKKEEEKKNFGFSICSKKLVWCNFGIPGSDTSTGKSKKKILQLLFVGSGVSQFLFNLFRLVPVW